MDEDVTVTRAAINQYCQEQEDGDPGIQHPRERRIDELCLDDCRSGQPKDSSGARMKDELEQLETERGGSKGLQRLTEVNGPTFRLGFV